MTKPAPNPVKPVHDIPAWSYMDLRKRVPGLDAFPIADLGWEFVCRLAENPGLAHDRDLLDLAYDVRCVLGPLTDFHWNRFSRAVARETVTRLVPLVGRVRAAIGPEAQLTTVDLGCGSWNPYGTSFLMLLAGADRAFAYDMDPPKNLARAVWGLSEWAAAALIDPPSVLGRFAPTARQVFDRMHGFDLAKLSRGDATGLAADRVRYEQRDAANLELATGSVDLVRSLAFFEHVLDVDAVLGELARITRPGGIGFHHIDAVDHRSYYWRTQHGGLDYLAHPVPGDVVSLPTPNAHRIDVQNRIRPHEWVDRFEAHGFAVESFVPMRPVEVDEAKRATFVEPYRSMTLEQLAPTAADYVLVRR